MNGHLHLAINSTATVTYCIVPPKPSLLNFFDSSNKVNVRVVICNAFIPYSTAIANSTEFLFYHYFEGEKITSFMPTSGYTSGGTILQLFGSGFRENSNYNCTFILTKNWDESVVRTVRASVMSETLLTCCTPELNFHGDAQFILSVNHTDNNLVVSTFSYLKIPTFSFLFPSVGSVLGGTVISINFDKYKTNKDDFIDRKSVV